MRESKIFWLNSTYNGIKLALRMVVFYERLVGSKRAFRKTIDSKLLTQRQLATVLTEVEAVINSHSLVIY